jgi:hypothetical protein
MKKAVSLITVTFLFVVWFTPSSAAQAGRDNRDRVCFYQDIHFRGWEQCYHAGDEVSDLGGQKNAISSIRIYGRARLVVYDETEFRGNTVEFNSDVPDLGLRNMSGSRSWSDRIESFRIAGNFGGGPLPVNGRGRNDDYWRGDRIDDRRDGVCVYEHANFRGRSECFGIGEEIRDFARVRGWNDQVSSIRVIGDARALFYADGGFRGQRLVVDRDLSDLAVIRLQNGFSWNDQISSLEVQLDRGRARARRW